MASACVNSNVTVSSDGFPSTFTSYTWLSPRLSLSREEEGPNKSAKPSPSPAVNGGDAIKSPAASLSFQQKQQQPPPFDESSDPEISGADFEFCLEHPVNVLPADELFADGKLMPLQLKPTAEKPEKVASPEKQLPRRINEVLLSSTSSDPSSVFSPKAPRCSSRWKEFLGLRKGSGSTLSTKENIKTATATSSSKFKYFLHRKSSSSSDVSLTSPLLRDSEYESLSLQSSRLSLSSSSSEDINTANPILSSRHSLDSDKPVKMSNMHPPRLRLVNNNSANINNSNSSNSNGGSNRGVAMRREGSGEGLAADSPRMNASGKIVFGNGTSLERSSSSPSPGGPRFNHRGMERSYSANVRIAPVLNVPVCSLRSSNGTGVFKFFGGSSSSSTTGSSSSSSQRRDSSLMRNNNKTDYRTVV